MENDLKIRIKIDKNTGALKVVKNEFQGVSNSINRAKKHTKSYHNQLINLAGAVGGIYAVKQGFDVVTASLHTLVDTAGRFEKFESILTTIEGSSAKAKQSFNWVKEFGANTPYEIEGVLDSFVKLKAYGIDPTDGTLKTLGDTASAMGKDLNQAVEAMADAVVGENERLKEFGIRASKQGDNIKYSWMTSSGEAKEKIISNNSKIIQSTLSAIFNEKYAGAMDDMSKTWIGLTSNLSDNWTNLIYKTSTTSGVFDKAKESVKILNNEFKLLDEDTEFIGDMGVIASGSMDTLIGGFGGVATAVVTVVDAFAVIDTGMSDLDKKMRWRILGLEQTWYEFLRSLNTMMPEFMQDEDRIQELSRGIVKIEGQQIVLEQEKLLHDEKIGKSYQARHSLLEKIKDISTKIQDIKPPKIEATKPLMIEDKSTNSNATVVPVNTKALKELNNRKLELNKAYYESTDNMQEIWNIKQQAILKKYAGLEKKKIDEVLKHKKEAFFKKDESQEEKELKQFSENINNVLEDGLQGALNGSFDFSNLANGLGGMAKESFSKSMMSSISSSDTMKSLMPSISSAMPMIGGAIAIGETIAGFLTSNNNPAIEAEKEKIKLLESSTKALENSANILGKMGLAGQSMQADFDKNKNQAEADMRKIISKGRGGRYGGLLNTKQGEHSIARDLNKVLAKRAGTHTVKHEDDDGEWTEEVQNEYRKVSEYSHKELMALIEQEKDNVDRLKDAKDEFNEANAKYTEILLDQAKTLLNNRNSLVGLYEDLSGDNSYTKENLASAKKLLQENGIDTNNDTEYANSIKDILGKMDNISEAKIRSFGDDKGALNQYLEKNIGLTLKENQSVYDLMKDIELVGESLKKERDERKKALEEQIAESKKLKDSYTDLKKGMLDFTDSLILDKSVSAYSNEEQAKYTKSLFTQNFTSLKDILASGGKIDGKTLSNTKNYAKSFLQNSKNDITDSNSQADYDFLFSSTIDDLNSLNTDAISVDEAIQDNTEDIASKSEDIESNTSDLMISTQEMKTDINEKMTAVNNHNLQILEQGKKMIATLAESERVLKIISELQNSIYSLERQKQYERQQDDDN